MTFAFCKTGFILELPSGPSYEVLQTRSAPPLKNIEGAGSGPGRAYRKPALRKLVEGKKSAAISVCDITRPAPNSVTLPRLL